MSGHSQWKNIKYRKEIVDKKRAKLFSKISRLIIVATKEKGADPETNPQLRTAIEKAQNVNMPKENIDRAIKKGSGQLQGENLEEITYEAYGPAGVAFIIEVITDNKNRTVAEIKHILNSFNGKMAETGSVRYQFDKANSGWQAKYPIEINDPKTKEKLTKLTDQLEENDDIQEVYSSWKTSNE